MGRFSKRQIYVVVAMLVVAAFWGYQMFGTATIAVTSEPSGAIVRVDGRVRGQTPIERLEVDAGRHRLEVIHSHYAPFVEGLRMSRGDHEKRHVVLKAGEGTLKLLSNPKNAWVEVDGERVGMTPMDYPTSSGPHVIRMGLEERHIVEETHILKDGATLNVNFNLNIDPHGSLTITTNPRNAKIEFIGEDLVYKPKLRLRIGEYSIRVSKAGYGAVEFRYDVKYGTNLHSVELQREYGQLNVRTEPQASEIQVSYQDGGRTRRLAHTGSMRVPTGPIEVRARARGYRTEHKRLNIGPQGATVRFNLTPFQVETGVEIKDTLKSGGAAPAMIVLPAGEFTMGDPNGSYSEKPARTISLTQPFAVSKYEITVGDFERYLAATGGVFSDKLDTSDPQIPVAYVSFNEAANYAAWLSEQTGYKYRLPSEAEWEYAARAGTNSQYYFGDEPLDLCQHANIADKAVRQVYREWVVLGCDDGMIRPGPVGSYQPNQFGLYDVYGNVAEWVADCGMPGYKDGPRDGSPDEEGVGCETRGIRGGSWDSQAAEARSAYRNTASSANDDRGIRLVREL